MPDTSPEMSSEKLADKIVTTFFAEMRRERRQRYFRTGLMAALFITSILMYTTFSNRSFLETASEVKQTYRLIQQSKSDATSKGPKLATIAVVPISGLISGDTIEENSSSNLVARVRNALRRIDTEKGQNLTTLVLYIDSPGGTVTASHELYQLILDWKKNNNAHVVAFLHSVAASGGYYVAQASDEIIADETALTGSIGVVISTLNFTELADKVGVRNETIKTGKFKDIGSPFRLMTTEEKQIFQILANESLEKFISVIGEGRKGRLTEEKIRKLADGRIFSGKQAKILKLVDYNGTFDELLTNEAERLIGGDRGFTGAEVVIYSTKEYSIFGGFFSRLFTPASMFQIDKQIRQPQLMYLWLGGLY